MLVLDGKSQGSFVAVGAGGGSGATIKGIWQPTVTGEPALTAFESWIDLGGEGTDQLSYENLEVTNTGTQAAAAIAPVSASLSDKLVVYSKFAAIGAGAIMVGYLYTGFLNSADDPRQGNHSIQPLWLVAGEGKLIDANAEVEYFDDWDVNTDSVAVVYNYLTKSVSYYTNRDTVNPLATFDMSDEEVANRIFVMPYAATETGETSATVSVASSFELTGIDADAINPLESSQSIDLTPPENAANNAFILDVAEPVYIPELDKELESGDIVFFDSDSKPTRYIPKEFADDADLSNYYTKSETNSALGTKVPKPIGFDEDEGDELKYISGKGTLKDVSTIQELGNMPDVIFSTENVTVGGVPIGYDALVVLDKSTWGFGLVTDLANKLVDNGLIVLEVEDASYQLSSTVHIPSEEGSQAYIECIAHRRAAQYHSNSASIRATSYNGQDSAGIRARCEWNATTKSETHKGLELYGETIVWRYDDNGTSDSTMARLVPTTPSTPTSAGKRGQLAADSDYLYICHATDSWIRVAKDSGW